MLKRLTGLLLACMLILGCALAEEHDAIRQSVLNLLTEVYGYTVEESERFSIRVLDAGDVWRVIFHDENHPEWPYTADYDKHFEKRQSSETPFVPSPAPQQYPGEGTVRFGLQKAAKEGWFTQWNDVSKAAMRQWMTANAVQPTPQLQMIWNGGASSAGNALHEYFISCYGDETGWTQALHEWHDAELEALGLTLEALPVQSGPASYQVQSSDKYAPATVTRFDAEIPQELAQALADPQLEGWQVLCGIYAVCPPSELFRQPENGLIALEKEGARLLVLLSRRENEAWKVYPIGTSALLPDRELYFNCPSMTRYMDIVYPISETESETFSLMIGDDNLCRLVSVSRANTATGEKTVIETGPDGSLQAKVRSADGREETHQTGVFQHRMMHLIDASAYPRSLQDCWQAESIRPPEGYGVTAGVHLRAQKSSRSKDLGMYHSGTLVEILGKEKGDPHDWYKVRIGCAEGYMASIYVDYEGSVCSMHPLTEHDPLPVAETTASCRLKAGTGWFAKTIQEIPAGTKMHVLAECGRWLHVMIPQGDIGWMMDINGQDGYVKAADVQMIQP